MKEARNDNSNLLKALNQSNPQILTIHPTPEDLERSQEVAEYIAKTEEAHKETAYSALRFGYKTCA